MKLSRKGRYAVTAMVALAQRQSNGPVALAAIATAEGMSISYLEQLFARFRQWRLVQGARGPGGGYRLARSAALISVADIIDAVEWPADSQASVGETTACLTHALWNDLSAEIHDFLDGITLAEVAEGEAVRAAAQ